MVVVLYALWLMGPYGPVERVTLLSKEYDTLAQSWGLPLDKCLEAREEMNGHRLNSSANIIQYECLPYSIDK